MWHVSALAGRGGELSAHEACEPVPGVLPRIGAIVARWPQWPGGQPTFVCSIVRIAKLTLRNEGTQRKYLTMMAAEKVVVVMLGMLPIEPFEIGQLQGRQDNNKPFLCKMLLVNQLPFCKCLLPWMHWRWTIFHLFVLGMVPPTGNLLMAIWTRTRWAPLGRP